MSAKKRLRILFLCAILAGCAVGPDYHTPKTAIPTAYVSSTTQPSTLNPAVDLANWWTTLNDPVLDQLVRRAISSNYDLAMALDRLQEARTMEVAIEGPALPFVNAAGSAARGSGNNSIKSRVGLPLDAAENTSGLTEITQVVGFDAGWELDLFGHYRRLIEAAKYDTQAAADARNYVLITVISDVARAYMDARTFQWRVKIIQDNVRAEQQMVNLVQQRYRQGITNELDVALAVRELATLQSAIAPLQQQAFVAQSRLAVLLGEFPDQLSSQLQIAGSLPKVPSQIQPGIPIQLLRRRPDILEAERQLASGTALIGADYANLFPSVAVTAGAGLQGQGLGRTPAGNDFIWSAGPSAYWPILDFGALDALTEVQEIATNQHLLNYKQIIISAVEEVENAISGYNAEQNQLANLSQALTASNRAVTLAWQRYDRGLTDFLNVLDAERQLYQLQDQYAVAQETGILQLVALYKGLGGGWENYQNIPPIRQPKPAILAVFRKPEQPKDP